MEFSAAGITMWADSSGCGFICWTGFTDTVDWVERPGLVYRGVGPQVGEGMYADRGNCGTGRGVTLLVNGAAAADGLDGG